MAPKTIKSIVLHPTPTDVRPLSKTEERKKAAESAARVGDLDLDMVSLLIRKSPKENSRIFWNALKALCLNKCGGAEEAFRRFSDNHDGLMSFQNFQELLDQCELRFNPRTTRFFFKQAVQEGEVTMTIQDFTSMVMVARIEKIRTALQEYNESLLRTSGHIDWFVSHLAMHTGETNRRRAITRFQHKLTLRFLIELRTAFQNWTVRMRWENPEVLTDVDCESFLRILESTCSIQGYEMEFLRNVFGHVDRSKGGRVKIVDLLVILMLVSAGNSRQEKSGFVFVLFDLDGKGCLTQEQLLLMYCTCTILAVIARGDRLSLDADILFGDELSLAKAKRLYDYTVERLAQNAVDEYCSFAEWWDAIGTNEMLLRELVPGTQSMDWVTTRPSGPVHKPNLSGARSPGSHKVRDAQMMFKDTRSADPVLRPESRLSAKDHLASANRSEKPEKRSRMASSNRCSTAGLDKRRHPLQVTDLMSAERFRVQATMRFRHAIRGEWDDVEALQRCPQEVFMQSRHVLVDKLPVLESSASGLDGEARLSSKAAGDQRLSSKATAELSEAAFEPTNSWTSEVSYSGWRQRQPNWLDTHQDTLANWVRAPQPGSSDMNWVRGSRPGSSSIGVSQSLPNLCCKSATAGASDVARPPSLPAPAPASRRRIPADRGPRATTSGGHARDQQAEVLSRSPVELGSPWTSSSPAMVKDSAAKKVAEAKVMMRMAEDGMPSEPQLFGKAAMARIRGCSEARVKCKDMPSEERLRMEPVMYECKLCKLYHA